MKNLFKDSFVVCLAYIPLGMGFGILASKELGFSIFEIFLSSLLIYAGSMQYALVGLASSNASLFMIFFTTLLVNFRHFFYTLTLLKELKECKNPFKHYLIFGLTDETFALLCAKKYTDNKKILLAFINHSYWILGGVLGGIFTQKLSLDFNGLDFTLIAFFTVLALELIKTSAKSTLICSIILALVSLFFIKQSLMLVFCLSFGALFLAIFYKKGIR